jgi:hypothetical protein
MSKLNFINLCFNFLFLQYVVILKREHSSDVGLIFRVILSIRESIKRSGSEIWIFFPAEGSSASVGNDVEVIFVSPQPMSESNRLISS